MDKKQEMAYLRKWGFRGKADYLKYVEEQMVEVDLEFIGQKVLKIFEDKVKEWVQDYLINKRERFVAKTERPPGEKVTKGPERTVYKILKSWEEYDQWQMRSGTKKGKPPKKHDPKDFLRTIPDLIRFRIVCNYLSDISHIDIRLQDFHKTSNQIKLTTWDDRIQVPFPERKVGHRAFQYVFKYSGERSPILFEVQVMTLLQHAWDKKDHHLIYEPVREGRGEKIPLHLKNRMAAMSELLFVADTVFDELHDDITNIMKKDKV